MTWQELLQHKNGIGSEPANFFYGADIVEVVDVFTYGNHEHIEVRYRVSGSDNLKMTTVPVDGPTGFTLVPGMY